jgi:hypothetical protein
MMTDVGKMQARRITRDEIGKGCLGKDNRGRNIGGSTIMNREEKNNDGETIRGAIKEKEAKEGGMIQRGTNNPSLFSPLHLPSQDECPLQSIPLAPTPDLSTLLPIVHARKGWVEQSA